MQFGGRVTQTADWLRERGFAVIARLADPLIMDRVEAELRPYFNAQPPGSSTLGWLDGRDPRRVLGLDA